MTAAVLLLATLTIAAAADAPAQAASSQAAPAQPGAAIDRLLVLDIAVGEGPAAEEARPLAAPLTELVAALLAERTSVEVLSADGLRARFALEAEKMTTGCSDESCVAELAGALGTRHVVFGRLTRLETTTLLKLELYDARAATTVADAVVRASTRAELEARLPYAADEIAREAELPPRARPAARPALAVVERSRAEPPFRWGLLVGGIGAATAVGLLGLGVGSQLVFIEEQRRLDELVADYPDEPTNDARVRIFDEHARLEGHRAVHNFVLTPLCCLSVPLCGVSTAFVLGDLGAMLLQPKEDE